MADVYVLASPTPTLYIYPSQLHPSMAPALTLNGPIWQRTPIRLRKRDDDETVLAALGAI